MRSPIAIAAALAACATTIATPADDAPAQAQGAPSLSHLPFESALPVVEPIELEAMNQSPFGIGVKTASTLAVGYDAPSDAGDADEIAGDLVAVPTPGAGVLALAAIVIAAYRRGRA